MIIIYTEKKSNRLYYICSQLLKHVLGFEFHISTHKDKCLNSEQPLICYSKNYIGKGIHIIPSGLLEEKDIHKQVLTVSQWNNLPIFYQTEGGDIPFDIFSAAFFLITRYEEYDDIDPDQHGRFKAENSLAYKYNFLDRPIVDEWTMALGNIIKEQYPNEKISSQRFLFVPTIDIDHVYQYRHKGIIISTYKILEQIINGNWNKALYILKVILRLEKDPFFNLKKLENLHEKCYRSTLFFCHCGAFGKYDKRTITPSIKYFLTKRSLSSSVTLGLHPSYNAAKSKILFKLEKWIFSKASKDNVMDIRFHYLRATFPDTYNMLVHQKIKNDWSMIYSNYCGFRAGTSFPFHFYNLKDETLYKLKIHPTAIMDKTLKQNMGLSREESYKYIVEMAEKVKAVGGTFVTLFHNDHLTNSNKEWKGWKETYKKVINYFYPSNNDYTKEQ